MKTLIQASLNVFSSTCSGILKIAYVIFGLYVVWLLFDVYPLVSFLGAAIIVIALFVLFEAGKIEDKKQRDINIKNRLRG